MKKCFVLFYAIVLGLAACAPIAPQSLALTPIPTQTKDDGCIPPVTEFEFPVREDRSSSETLFVPLPAEWKMQATLNESSQTSLELIEHHLGYDTFWLRSDNQFFLYRTDTRQWESISFGMNGDETLPVNLFQSQSGQVWALQLTSRKTVPLFLRLGEDRKFEFVDDAAGELTTDWRVWGELKKSIDEYGIVWFVAEHNSRDETALYSFDPQTTKAKKHISGKRYEFGASIALAQDGSIFLSRSKEKEIVQYFPATETSRTISVKEVAEGNFVEQGYVDLFFDRLGRLWLNDFGWLDLTTKDYPTWHQIVRSPIFITKNISPFYTYVWARPVPLIESSDGRILFRRGGGLTWLDPAKGKWCKFSTVDTNVLSDGNGNLWLLYNNNLYEYVP